jgi:hypothetical protein
LRSARQNEQKHKKKLILAKKKKILNFLKTRVGPVSKCSLTVYAYLLFSFHIVVLSLILLVALQVMKLQMAPSHLGAWIALQL